MSKAELVSALEADVEKHIAFLQEFIRAPSPNPPGDTQEAAAVIRRYLDGQRIEHTVIAPQSHLPNIVSEFEGSMPGKRLIMNGHIDVFPVGDASGWDRDPWSGNREDGLIHGRGATDMKTGTAASIIAFSYLQARKTALKGSIGLTAVSDEETGGKWGSRYLLESDPRWAGDCMINAEPSGLGTIRFAEKGTLRLTFTVATSGAHGAYVHRTESASRLAAALIARLAEVEAIDPRLPTNLREYLAQERVRLAVDEAVGAGAADIIAKPTLNIGTIRGGLKVNMIPDRCVFEADIRMPMGLVAEQVMTKIAEILRAFPQVTVAIQEAASNPASASPHDHPMVDMLAKNVEAITGRRPFATPSLGATDAKFWRYRDIPAYLYGPAPGRMAATNESVPIDEFMTVIKAHALAAWDYLSGS